MPREVKESRRVGRGHTRISAKNQATIPVAALRAAGLNPGDELEVTATGPGEVAFKRRSGRFDKYFGCMPEGTYAPGYLAELRSEWDRS